MGQLRKYYLNSDDWRLPGAWEPVKAAPDDRLRTAEIIQRQTQVKNIKLSTNYCGASL